MWGAVECPQNSNISDFPILWGHCPNKYGNRHTHSHLYTLKIYINTHIVTHFVHKP